MTRGSSLIAALLALSAVIPFSASALNKPTCVISTPPGTITPGSLARIIWYSEGATSGFISNGIGQVKIPSGYADVHPSVSTMYTLTVSNAAGKNTCSVIITVKANPPTLLSYISPQPLVFYPVNYVQTLPIGGGQYSRMYGDTIEIYDEYGYGSMNRKYDFWSDYTRGPSTGPSLFEIGGNSSIVRTYDQRNGATYYQRCYQGLTIDICDEPYSARYEVDGAERQGGIVGDKEISSGPTVTVEPENRPGYNTNSGDPCYNCYGYGNPNQVLPNSVDTSRSKSEEEWYGSAPVPADQRPGPFNQPGQPQVDPCANDAANCYGYGNPNQDVIVPPNNENPRYEAQPLPQELQPTTPTWQSSQEPGCGWYGCDQTPPVQTSQPEIIQTSGNDNWSWGSWDGGI